MLHCIQWGPCFVMEFFRYAIGTESWSTNRTTWWKTLGRDMFLNVSYKRYKKQLKTSAKFCKTFRKTSLCSIRSIWPFYDPLLATLGLVVAVMPRQGKRTKAALDTFACVPEAEWYHAESDWPAIRKFCKDWCGERDLFLVSVFDRSKRVLKQWEGKGYKGVCFDLHHSSTMDIVSRAGFFLLLSMLMRLLPHSFSMWAPPCSLMIFLTSSLHKRHVHGCDGDTRHLIVRLSNLIRDNCCMALKAVLKFRPDSHTMVEQPKGTWMYKAKLCEDLIKGFGMQQTLTYQGLFGAPLMKPTSLLHTFPCSILFARTATKSLREKRKKKHPNVASFYVKTASGGVHGTKKLTSTSLYPLKLIRAIYSTWLALRPWARESL